MAQRDDLSARTVTVTLGADDGDAFTVNSGGSEKFSVDADGNAIIAGTLEVTGAQTLTGAPTVAGMLTANGGITMGDGDNIVLNTTTGTKIGTAASQKLGFYNATPVVQRTLIADPSGGATQDAEARTAIVAIIDALVATGLMAAS